MVYTALLRGINVGGKNKIAMPKLKESFESVGMTHVVTYINSGNIIFQWHAGEQTAPEKMPETAADVLSQKLEAVIERDFGLAIKVLVLDMNAMTAVMETLPDAWQNDDAMKSDVMFLWELISEAELRSKLKIVGGIDTVYIIKEAIFWSVLRENATRSGMTKVVGTALYKKMTVRNVNTVRKIYALMLTNDQV
ncbi:DUF1697 domain-containing protein [Fusibacter paucivorans]|uniref:DUF1697 domain-containing protein n=1 Tax=Fusibacter paucivorans TaxID=76009 RepID=A0ABS5PK02_9FIRM|nr:DUF1697 domain-containing protein [Fusibacter paucivorans]MBS7525142.1 DUF1697 domain-containing protein [Fusibacter paucivorans]